MRFAKWKLVLSVIAVSAVTMLGVGPAAASGCYAPSVTFHLDYDAGNFFLNQAPPGAATAKYLDSPVLSRAGGNPYTVIGEWDDGYVGSLAGCVLGSLNPLHVWLGLRNSDDQGTNFDLKAEVHFQGSAPASPIVLVATAERLCIKGLTRNPALAQEIISSFSPPPPNLRDGEYSLTLYARIGSSACGGHASATGLRVYYDSAARDSRFGVNFTGG